MRLFVAVEFKGEELNKLRDNFNLRGIKPVNSFHLTLKFLGEVKEEKVDRIKELLGRIKFNKFKVRLDKVGVFPDEIRINIVWVGLKPEGILNVLQRKVEGVLGGMFGKEEKFKAHITLARVKFLDDKEALKEKIKIKFKEEEYEVSEIKLIKSELTREGPIHTELFCVKGE